VPYRERVSWLRSSAPILALGTAAALEALLAFGADGPRVTLALAMAAPLLLRRTHPSVALLLVNLGLIVQLAWPQLRLFDQTVLGFVCLWVAAYSLGRYGTGPAVRTGAVVAAAAGCVVIGVTDRDAVSGLLAAAILGAPVLVGQAVHTRAAARAALVAQNRLMEESTVEVAASQAAEARARAGLAVQETIVLAVRSITEAASRARQQLAAHPSDPEAVRLLGEAEQTGRDALTGMRSTLGALRVNPTVPAATAFHASDDAWMIPALARPAAWLPGRLRPSHALIAVATFWAFACILVALRAEVPAAVVVVGMVLSGVAGALEGRPARGVGLVLSAIGVVAVNLTGGFSGIGDYVVPLVLMALSWLGGSAVRQQQVLLAEVAVQAEKVRGAHDALAAAAVVQERLALARELHDVVAHHLMVMVVQVGAARRTVESGRPGALTALEVVERTGSETLAEVHSLLELVDPAGHPSGPAPGMAQLAPLLDRVRSSGVAVELVVDGDPRPMSDGVDLVAHRIVQESLTNVIRHAGARRVRVHVRWMPDRLHVDVVDDGRGLTGERGPGLGVPGMRERAEQYGGTCTVTDTPRGGVHVQVMLPLVPVEAPA